MGKGLLIGASIVAGVFVFGFILTLILTSVIITSSLDDTWIKPGEQVVIQSSKKFSVTPQKDGVVAHIFPSGLISTRTEIRSTNENLDGIISGTSTKEITRFHSKYNDKLYVEFNPESSGTLDVFYYKKVVTTTRSSSASTITPNAATGENGSNNDNPIDPQKKRKKKGSSSSSSSSSKSKTTTKIVRFSVLKLSGTGFLSNSSTLPGDYEYIIGVSGIAGASYDVNITYERKYYVSNNVISCPVGEETFFNSEKSSDYHAVLEMAYDGPITEPKDAKNELDLYRAERFNGGDVAAIVTMLIFMIISLLVVAALFFGGSSGGGKDDVEMDYDNDNNDNNDHDDNGGYDGGNDGGFDGGCDGGCDGGGD